MRADGMRLLINSAHNVILRGVADFNPAFVGGNVQRGVGVNFRIKGLVRFNFNHRISSFRADYTRKNFLTLKKFVV